MRNMEFHLGGQKNRDVFYDNIEKPGNFYYMLKGCRLILKECGPLRVSSNVSVNLSVEDIFALVQAGYDPRRIDICQFGRAKLSMLHHLSNSNLNKSCSEFYYQYLGLPSPWLRERGLEIGVAEAAIELGVLEIEST